MLFQWPDGKDVAVCAAIGGLMFLMASTRNARLRGLLVSLPIPLTLILWSRPAMSITAGHVLGIVLLAAFFWGNWALYSVLRVPLVASMAIATGGYVIVGSYTRRVTLPPYWPALGCAVVWLLYVVLLYRRHIEAVPPARLPPWLKAAGTFVVCLFFFSLARTIGPALATAPLLSYFTVVECRKCLHTICLEFSRNVIAIVAYLVVFKLADKHAFGLRAALAWAAVLASFAVIGLLGRALRRVPRAAGQPTAA